MHVEEGRVSLIPTHRNEATARTCFWSTDTMIRYFLINPVALALFKSQVPFSRVRRKKASYEDKDLQDIFLCSKNSDETPSRQRHCYGGQTYLS